MISAPTVLISSDLHLVETPSESYRWELFPWAAKIATEQNIKHWFILGDILDKKDRHPAELVNHLVDNLTLVLDSSPIKNIYLLQGNHDYLKSQHPFLRFLNQIDSVVFFNYPYLMDFFGKRILWLPHTKTPEKDWNDSEEILGWMEEADYIFFHQSVYGAKVSNYYEMKEGLDKDFFTGVNARLYSGDIHVPQHLPIPNTPNGMEYIGTPYPIAFGDTYTPRNLLLNVETGKAENIQIDSLKNFRKLSLKIRKVEDLAKEHLNQHTHAKVTMRLPQSERHNWPEYKARVQEAFKKAGAHLFDLKVELDQTQKITPRNKPRSKLSYSVRPAKDVVQEYGQAEKLDQTLVDVGLDLIEKTVL